MEIKWPCRISPRVYLLGTHHFNSFLVGGEQYALIEAGMGCSAPAIIRQYRELGLDAEKLKLIIVMHAHPDHSTGIPYLMEAFPAARVVGSREAQRSLAREKVVRHFMAEDRAMSEIMQARGELEIIPDPPAMAAMPVHQTVDEGDVIDLGGGCRLDILKTPGHSPCSISAFLPGDRVLFISDAGGFQTSSRQIFPIFFSGYQDYLDSLERLRSIRADILALPHEQCHQGREEIDSFYDFAVGEAQRMKENIVRWLERGLSPEAIADRIVEEHYRDNLRIYTLRNIQGCADSLIKRVAEIM